MITDAQVSSIVDEISPNLAKSHRFFLLLDGGMSGSADVTSGPLSLAAWNCVIRRWFATSSRRLRIRVTIGNIWNDESNLAKRLHRSPGTANDLSISSIIFARWHNASRSVPCAVRPILREIEVLGGQRWHHSKERWWFPISCALWPLRYLLAPFGWNLPSNVSIRWNQQGLGYFGTKFLEEGVDRCKRNFNAIWNTYGAVVCKRNCVDIFCRLSRMHERDR